MTTSTQHGLDFQAFEISDLWVKDAQLNKKQKKITKLCRSSSLLPHFSACKTTVVCGNNGQEALLFKSAEIFPPPDAERLNQKPQMNADCC